MLSPIDARHHRRILAELRVEVILVLIHASSALSSEREAMLFRQD
jgi:hypothetical protein